MIRLKPPSIVIIVFVILLIFFVILEVILVETVFTNHDFFTSSGIIGSGSSWGRGGDNVGVGSGGGGGGVQSAYDNKNKNKNNNNKRQNEQKKKRGQLIPLDKILEKAGVHVTNEIRNQLPSIDEVESLYGPVPIIHGLSKCETFRNTIKKEDRFIGPAGLFNTGTNLLSELLQANCVNKARQKVYGSHSKGIRMQVPWGKHNPISWRLKHTAEIGGKQINHTHFLPIVLLKDPYTWMSSMCRHPYEANWFHDSKRHCPNLYPILPQEIKKFGQKQSIPVTVKYNKKNITTHDSLLHLWNEWYQEWGNATFPFLMIRFEDLLLHAEEIIPKICACAGMNKVDDTDKFHYIEQSAKQGGPHEGSSNFVTSMVRYTNSTKRIENFWDSDLHYVRRHVLRGLTEFFQYKIV